MRAPAPIATIDIGTNTTLLLIARPRVTANDASNANNYSEAMATGEAEVLADEAEITRLGRGIGIDGGLGRDGIDRTLAVLQRYARLYGEIAAREALSPDERRIVAVGTEALRRAPNAAAFLGPAAKILGAPVEVIDGDREAQLTFRAVAASFPLEMAAGRVAIVDIGGGSTEIIVADRGTVMFRRSLPLGSVRLHERHIHRDPPSDDEVTAIEAAVSAELDSAAEAFTGPPPGALVGVAGTVTSLAAMTMELPTYDSTRVHGARLSLQAIDEQVSRLTRATQAERERIVGLDPRRADVILGGALLLRSIVRRFGADGLRVSDRGIRWGLFHERALTATDGAR